MSIVEPKRAIGVTILEYEDGSTIIFVDDTDFDGGAVVKHSPEDAVAIKEYLQSRQMIP